MREVFVRRAAVCFAIAGLLGAGPLVSTVQAQDDKVFALAELEAAPKLRSAADAGRSIQESYPEELRRRGVGGMVELQFVVDKKGNVVPSSVEVLDATQTQLGAAAKKLAPKLQFIPGKVGGESVSSKVVLPIMYKPN